MASYTVHGHVWPESYESIRRGRPGEVFFAGTKGGRYSVGFTPTGRGEHTNIDGHNVTQVLGMVALDPPREGVLFMQDTTDITYQPQNSHQAVLVVK